MINSGNNSSPSLCHGGPEICRDDNRQGDQRMRHPELGRQLELLESQPERLGRQPELPWSMENPSVVLATIAALIALAGVKFQNSSDNPFHSRPVTMTLSVIALSIYCFAAAWTRPIILDGKQQQILMWRILNYCYRLLNSLVQISRVVCQACIASLFIPYGPGWNVYVACASSLCVGVAVWAILRNFAPSRVVRLLQCMGLTGSSGGSEKNDGVSDCGNDGRNRIAESNGSPVSDSSLVWENQSSSQQGGTSSSDTGSHSSYCKAEQSQSNHTCEHGVPSHQTDLSTQANSKTANTGNAVAPHINQFSPNKGAMSKAHLDPDEKPIQSPNPLKAAGGRECDKREKKEERGDNNNGAQNLSQGTVPPVVPYLPLQFVPLADGFVYPCVVPCLSPTVPSGGSEKNEGNVLQPVACRSFWPGQGGFEAWWFGGSSSSDTGSHSSHCKPDQSQLKYSCEHGVPSSQTETTHANCKTTKNTNRAVPSRAIKSSPTKLMEQTDSETHPNAEDKPLTSQNSNPGSMKVASDQRLDAPSLSQMPCVSTTGNGPNGKTITGFLYRYTKTEVSIVCVCHGSSFSPAEFVEYAGGKHITHPLSHITVIPSAFR
ncbi:hypothetical protein RHSIM_RhsimUnG0108100 [Rhododendron simsii]|uniref:Ninja-family protein n=1 Tax=Rhododendron simsii TaxID=118357 RepID=A0A834FXF0_RHOSS|nr:hypothetical protein RHSIM_RhsimUnG0108100 [Rhododendron simsii]